MTETEVNHADRAHATFGPSGLKYVKQCPAFHGKDGTNPAAEMGTRIHEALEVEDCSALEHEEEIEIYHSILSERNELLRAYFQGDIPHNFLNEIRVAIELDAETPCFGTCDFLAFDSGRNVSALMIDYKTGISKIDPPEENMQAKAYALGAFQKYPDIDSIHFAFIVPRNGGTLMGVFTREQMPELRKEISGIIRKAETTRPKWDDGTIDIEDCSPSYNCRFCRHEERCPALGAVSVAIAGRISPELLPDGPIRSSEVEDPKVLAKLYKVARIVENWVDAIKFRAMSAAIAGETLEGLRLKSMGKPMKIEDNVNAANLATQEFGLDIDDVLKTANLSLSKIASEVASNAPRGQKGKMADAFRYYAIDLGIAVEGKERFTLVDDESDFPETGTQE
jgi:hypothetical protein